MEEVDPKTPSPKERELYVSAFLDRVKFDDLQRVPKYLETLSVNERDAEGNTALHCCKSLEMLNFLLERGADVFARNKHEIFPIAFAGSVEIFKRLAEAMTVKNARALPSLNAPMDSNGFTFFQLLLVNKSFEVVEWLMSGNFCETPQLFHKVDSKSDSMKMAIISGAPTPILCAIRSALPVDYELDD